MTALATHVKVFLSLAIAATVCFTTAPAAAWNWPAASAISGSGAVSRVQRTAQGFKGIELEVPAQVTLVQGETEGLVIETDDNIAPHIETVVDGARLKIRLAQRHTDIKPTVLKITVQARLIESLVIAGSGKLQAERIASNALTVRVAGSGDVRIQALDVNSLSLSIAGSGDFSASGRADTVQTRISGSGDVRAANLAAKIIKVSIAGSGSAKVWASESLSVNVAGSGDITYYGDATVTQSVAGSGRIQKMGSTPPVKTSSAPTLPLTTSTTRSQS